jgi:hypothetical protein
MNGEIIYCNTTTSTVVATESRWGATQPTPPEIGKSEQGVV